MGCGAGGGWRERAFGGRSVHGEALALTGAILGHSNLRSTAIYAHVQHDFSKRAATRVTNEITAALSGSSTAANAPDDDTKLLQLIAERYTIDGVEGSRFRTALLETIAGQCHSRADAVCPDPIGVLAQWASHFRAPFDWRYQRLGAILDREEQLLRGRSDEAALAQADRILNARRKWLAKGGELEPELDRRVLWIKGAVGLSLLLLVVASVWPALVLAKWQAAGLSLLVLAPLVSGWVIIYQHVRGSLASVTQQIESL